MLRNTAFQDCLLWNRRVRFRDSMFFQNERYIQFLRVEGLGSSRAGINDDTDYPADGVNPNNVSKQRSPGSLAF